MNAGVTKCVGIWQAFQFDEVRVGAPRHFFGGQPLTFQWSILSVKPTFDLEAEEPQKRDERIGRVTAIILNQILSNPRAQVSRVM